VVSAISPDDVHYAPTKLVWLENTHNRGGGLIFPQEEVEAISKVAHQNQLPLHMDGARLFHAAIAQKITSRELVAVVDSLSICLSKGLGAPMGSVLAGNKAFIKSARRFRKMLGGGMRQAGIMAAAGIYVLEHNLERLVEDHEKARCLADGLKELSGVRVNLESVQTNIVIFELINPKTNVQEMLSLAKQAGLLLSYLGENLIRAVTHLDLSLEDCQKAVQILRKII